MLMDRFIFACSLVCLTIGANPAPAQTDADTQVTAGGLGGVDCTEASVDFVDDPSLTAAERLAKMDQALQRSLNKFDACQTARSRGGAVDGSGSGAGGGFSGNGSARSGATGASGDGSVQSTASSDMTGTEVVSAPEEASASGFEPTWSDPGPDAQADQSLPQEETGARRSQTALANGKAPEDIPPADNDSVLEAQIRAAAEREADPEIRKRLWNEYRKYKGLPTVD